MEITNHVQFGIFKDAYLDTKASQFEMVTATPTSMEIQ